MGNIQAPQKSSTLYSQLVNSKPAQFAKDNPVLAGAGTIGTGVIIAEAARRSDMIAKGVEKGLIPAVSAGAAVLGVSMVKDALQNDWKNFGNKENNTALQFIGKTAGGTAMAITGTEVAGRYAFGVSPIGKAAEAISNVIPSESIGFGVLALAGTASALLGAKSMKEKGLTIGNATALGLGGTATVGFTNMAVWEASSHSEIVMQIGDKVTGVVGGAALGLGAVALGKTALNAMNEGKSGKAVLAAVGATTAGAAAIHVLGNASGVEALSNLGQKVFMKNPLLAGSITAVAMAGAGYYMYSKA
ncbi:MAG: hypothetical protein ACAI44_23290, partial [Candidatus Sericytochromatia bacterium]